MKHINSIAFVVACLVAIPTPAADADKKLKIGDPAPAWKDLPGVDGKEHSLSDLKDKDVVVVVFTCNSCPYAIAYEDRLIAFAKKHSDSKVAVVAINVNTVDEDKLPKMKERAQKKGFPFPYLYDATQKIARDFGAARTPEFFVLNKERKVVYKGALDDRSDAKEVKVNYLEPAVEAALKGEKPEKAETLATGCLILYSRKRADD